MTRSIESGPPMGCDDGPGIYPPNTAQPHKKLIDIRSLPNAYPIKMVGAARFELAWSSPQTRWVASTLRSELIPLRL